MNSHKIEPHKITKPISLMAVWFVALILLDASFLTAAAKIKHPAWLSPLLVISAIVLVPIFLVGVFLLQTVFRKELQEDQYFAEWLKRNDETFGDFKDENIRSGELVGSTMKDATPYKSDTLEVQRVERYEAQQGLFLVHSWRPSATKGQVADIVIWLHQHREGPLSDGFVKEVRYQLGPLFFDGEAQIKKNAEEQFKLEVSAYGPMLCLATVYVEGHNDPIILERYIDFEEVPSGSRRRTYGHN